MPNGRGGMRIAALRTYVAFKIKMIILYSYNSNIANLLIFIPKISKSSVDKTDMGSISFSVILLQRYST